MVDPKVNKLAKILVDYSVNVKKDDKVLISLNQAAWPLGKEVYKLCLTKGAYPYIHFSTGELNYFFFKNASPSQLTHKPEVELMLAKWADKFIRLYSAHNNSSLANINPHKIMTRAKAGRQVKDIMLKKPWVLTEFPSLAMAQTANMSLDELENIYFKACLQDWPKIGSKLKKLKKTLDNAANVEIIGLKTNLKLSFTNRYFQVADGKYNMPDGEVFSAPVDNSAQGSVYFDLPSLSAGHIVKGVHLTFKKGKVVKAKAKKGQKYLNAALSTDPGAKRLGEFALGANYGLKKPMLNTLFDEKIGGTLHMALGNAYPEKEGGGINKSAIHWDLVKSMNSIGSIVTVNSKPILKEGQLLP